MCLSLLGTWGQSWDPQRSTLLQVSHPPNSSARAKAELVWLDVCAVLTVSPLHTAYFSVGKVWYITRTCMLLCCTVRQLPRPLRQLPMPLEYALLLPGTFQIGIRKCGSTLKEGASQSHTTGSAATSIVLRVSSTPLACSGFSKSVVWQCCHKYSARNVF